MGKLGWLARVKLKAQIRRELIALRAENRQLDDDEFRALAEDYIRNEYEVEGIDPDNLRMILDFLREILPIILELFLVLLVMAVFCPNITEATEGEFPFARMTAIEFPFDSNESVVSDKSDKSPCDCPDCEDGQCCNSKSPPHIGEPARSMPVWLGNEWRYPNWTPPRGESVWDHLLDPTDAHYSILMDAGYTDRQLRSLSYAEATALHSHLHNYFQSGRAVVSPVAKPVQVSTPVITSA